MSEPVRAILLGDRLCAGCKVNLAGEPIFQEHRYGLSVVRCPRCERIAAIEE